MTPANKSWRFEPGDTAGGGRVHHLAPPRFTAAWGNGAAATDGPSWHDSASGEDDLRLFAFQWHDPPPAPADLEHLLRAACVALDAWIAERL